MLIQENKNSISVQIRVQPKASKNEVVGIQGDELKVRLTAPPVDGAANKACIEFFAKLYSISKNRVEIVQGLTGRSKKVKLEGITQEEFLLKIQS